MKSAREIRIARALLLALILLVPGAIKLWHRVGDGPHGVDGALYVNAARHVQEGRGVRTSVSLYHAGHTELPARSPLIYPLWPLLLGLTARVTGLAGAVDLLPRLLYFLDLILLYLVARRCSRREGIFTAAHLVVFVLATNLAFFNVTTFPYTEGLGLCFALLAVLLLDRGARLAGFAGVAAGLGLATRSQLVIVGIAIGLTLLWDAWRTRRAHSLLAFGGVYAVFAGWWYFGFLHGPASPAADLTHYPMFAERSAGALLRGFLVSITPGHPSSYWALLGPVVLLAFVWGAVALVRLVKRTASDRWIEMGLVPIALVLTGLGIAASLNLYQHNPAFPMPAWLFGHRHALPLFFLLIPATVRLYEEFNRPVRYFTVAVCVATALLGLSGIFGFVTTPRQQGPAEAERQFIAWADAQTPAPTILATQPQQLAAWSRANYHWTICNGSPAQTRLMLAKLPIDYVLVYERERRCSFVAGLGRELRPAAAFGPEGARIYLLERSATLPRS